MTYKIALILKGVHFMNNYKHHSGLLAHIDWSLTKENIKKYFIDDALKQGHTVDVYISTYEGHCVPDIIEYYKPKECMLFSFGNVNQVYLTKEILKHKSLQEGEYDFHIVTRFDLFIKQNIYDLFQLDTLENRLCVPWIETNEGLIGDCIMVVPKGLLGTFIHILDQYYQEQHLSFHYLSKHIKDIKYMIDGIHDSNSDKQVNPIYHITRCIVTNKFAKYLPARVKCISF